MGWTLDKATGVWKCTQYSDLQYAEITNLAEYGEPFSPYEPGFDQTFVPDFDNVIIEMPQIEVMTNGYGSKVTANNFPIARRFLTEALKFGSGRYVFADLVKLGFAKAGDRILKADLYMGGNNGVTPGTISAGDAAFIHGTVGLALMAGTKFIYDASGRLRTVDAEIGALDDNWDFESSTIPGGLNAVVGTLFGPDHYNLTKPIQMRYRGPGKRSVVTQVT
jgi:hypothetical protein